MPKVENTNEQTRVWPGIQTAEGTTLELDPGESAEVDELPEDFEDPHLKVGVSATGGVVPGSPVVKLGDGGTETLIPKTNQEPTP